MTDTTQQAIWTAVPNGLTPDGSSLRVSIVVSPRLIVSGRPSAELGEFGDFADWPGAIRRAKVLVTFDGRTSSVNLPGDASSKVWTAIFPKTTRVNSHEFEDLAEKKILSYPVEVVHDELKQKYTALASEPDLSTSDLPTLSSLQAIFGDIRDRPAAADVMTSLVNGALYDDFEYENPLHALSILEQFHRPLADEIEGHYTKQGDDDPREDSSWRTYALAEMPDEETLVERFDFHTVVAALEEYGQLLRQLGLVIDVEVPLTALRLGDKPTTGDLALQIVGLDSVKHVLPVTRARFESPDFVAVCRDAGSPIEGRMLRLAEPRFRLLQTDVDGTAIKAENFASTLFSVLGEPSEQELRLGAPSLRSDGFVLVESRAHASLSAAFERSRALQDALEAGKAIVLYAENLTRGVHVDVLDETRKRWQSLCRRDGTYRLENTGEVIRTSDEEGVVQIGVTSAADGSHPDVIKFHEGLFGWSGWSLAAPMPGRALDVDDGEARETVGDFRNEALAGMPLEVNFTPSKRSLPSLRYGRSYRLRARMVDLAHNAEPFTWEDIGSKRTMTGSEIYYRFEPVPSPVLTLVSGVDGPEPPGAGESMRHIAIRTFDEEAPEPAHRQVVAPRATIECAQTHGMLDTEDGRLDGSNDTYKLLASKDRPLEEVRLPAEDGSDVTYAVAPERSRTPYLPDPLAVDVAARAFVNGQPSPEIVTIPYYPDRDDTWPEARSFVLKLEKSRRVEVLVKEGATGRVLVVRLPEAETLSLRLSHRLSGDALAQLGLWSWVEESIQDPTLLDDLRKHALDGQHWMLTPWTQVEFVHAVQRPLVTPQFNSSADDGGLAIGRNLSETTARLSFTTPIDSRSTAKFAVFGEWNEPAGSVAQPGPGNAARSARVLEQTLSRGVAAGEDETFPVLGALHEFGDTRYRRVEYRIEATTRFREYMPPEIRNSPRGEALKVSSAVQTAWVPNSAPPPAPDVLYVMPTFEWERRPAGERAYISRRSGGGLRVYLKGPWYTSGYGEMLAVVLAVDGTSSADMDGPLKRFVTRWGRDPIWDTSQPPDNPALPPPVLRQIPSPAPSLEQFRLALTHGPIDPQLLPDGVPPSEAELPGGGFRVSDLEAPGLGADGAVVFDVAPHAVGWDAARALWFCDIVIDPGEAYFPFVQLALARYQPTSLDGAHLSTIRQPEVVQLVPDRLVVARRGVPSQPDRVTVNVFGRAARNFGGERITTSAVPGQPTVVVRVEARDRGTVGDLGWEPVPGAAFAPVLESGAPMPFIEDLVESDVPPDLWSGVFTLQEMQEAREYRIMVREYEQHQVDPENESDDEPEDNPAYRLVYAEAVLLDDVPT